MTFDPADPRTYPITLTAAQVAAIYHKTPAALRRAVLRGRFAPAPYRTHPPLWRRADVIADVEPLRAATVRIRHAS